MGKSRKAIRGSFFDFVDDPWKHVGQEQRSARFVRDGLLVIEDGKIIDFGEWDRIGAKHAETATTQIKNRLIMPGFVDGHLHMAQTRVLGSYGEQLLGWLQTWIFPEEAKYSNPEYAKEGAYNLFENLLASGTTTCQAFTTHDPVSTEAFFQAASERNMLVIGGLTGIDRFAPEGSMDTPENFYRDTKKLIAKWHGTGRNLYAITPRFALGATPEMMEVCRKLRKEYPDVWINTHLAENPTETRDCIQYHNVPDYVAAYEKYDLVGPKFTGGHGVWLSDDEFKRLSKAGAAVAFCPVSNLFLGSGLFRLGTATSPIDRVRVAFGTDTGGGNRFCMLKVLDEAYKVGMCNNTMLDGSVDMRQQDLAAAERSKLSSYRAFWSITLGGAEALYLNDRIGNFDLGKEADFVVLDWMQGQRAIQWQQSLISGPNGPATMDEAATVLFSIMTLGDDRNVDETWVMGERLYSRHAEKVAAGSASGR